MKLSRSISLLICSVVAISGCSEETKSGQRDTAEVEFDIGANGFEHSEAARLIGAMRVLVDNSVNPIRVRFILRGEVLAFDVLGAEPKAAYNRNRILPQRSGDGGWIVKEPAASPPGEIELDWIRVGTDLVSRGGEWIGDAEFSDWLQSYAYNLTSIQERSVLVIDVEDSVDSGRLFAVLRMVAAEGLDRVLVERKAEQAGADQPAAASEPESEDIKKPTPPRPSGWRSL